MTWVLRYITINEVAHASTPKDQLYASVLVWSVASKQLFDQIWISVLGSKPHFRSECCSILSWKYILSVKNKQTNTPSHSPGFLLLLSSWLPHRATYLLALVLHRLKQGDICVCAHLTHCCLILFTSQINIDWKRFFLKSWRRERCIVDILRLNSRSRLVWLLQRLTLTKMI